MDFTSTTTTKNVNSDINQISLSYVTSHYEVKEMTVEDFYKKFIEVRKELSNLWGKY